MALRRLGVLGWPVDHSRSPAMQNAALAAAGLGDAFRYERVPVTPEAFAETVAGLAAAGFAGVNVTIPHKEAALALATEASADARAIGAANTLTFGAAGAIRADNTDAPGVLDALGDPLPASALVLGAGGSARAVAYALRASGADVAVWNRTHARAASLADDLGVRAVAERVPAEVLVNCTSVGLRNTSPTFKDLPLNADEIREYACVVDLVYRDGGTGLLQEAERQGCRVVDGLEVLVRQGAKSFEIWTGRTPSLEVMRRAARSVEPLPESSPSPTGRLGAGGRG
ncbi:MAG: shikimate dehydrogenase [Solirubrobacteraceae bacterium]|nr:shikimate dehydrogenase [Solirubrobacteraceae bacterium]